MIKETIKKLGRTLLVGMLAVCSIGGGAKETMAYDTRVSQLVNHFSVGNTDIEVMENFDGTTKSDVKIVNRGNISVYVRAAVVVYWKDSKGKVMLEQPTDKDYTLVSAAQDSGWAVSAEDGFFYYKDLLEPGEKTPPLVENCVDLKTYDDGRILVVDVAAQSIQQIPSKESKEVAE